MLQPTPTSRTFWPVPNCDTCEKQLVSFFLNAIYDVQCDYKSWRCLQIHGRQKLILKTISFWINCVRVLWLFNHWRKEYERKHVRKPKGTKQVWCHTSLRLSDSTFCPCVSHAKLRTLTLKEGSISLLFPFPSFPVTPFIISNAVTKVEKRVFLSVYCCSHTQSTLKK